MSAADMTIAFQGFAGAYSDLACRQKFPEMTTLPCPNFEEAFAAVREGRAKYAMIPVENSIAGRVADIHYLLPTGGLHIIGEHYVRVNHHLLAPKGATLETVKEVHSHIQALSQCREMILEQGYEPITHADTAGAAVDVAKWQDPSKAAIASSLAGELNDLDVLIAGAETEKHNTTRFIILSREPVHYLYDGSDFVTSLVFKLRSVPAALYKALGGFATNGLNLTKIESYLLDGNFQAVQFFCEVEGHPDERHMRLALEELEFFAREVQVLGTYKSDAHRVQERGSVIPE